MEINIWERKPISNWRVMILTLNYFIGFIIVYPFLMRILTLWIDPYATMVPVWLQYFVYAWMIFVSVVAGWPLLVESYHQFKQREHSFLKTIFTLLGIFYICTIFVNVMIMFFSQTETSANQMEVVSSIQMNSYLMVFSTCVYAPIVEEMLFRGVFFRCVRSRCCFAITAMISAFSFGFLHVMESFSSGNFNDMWYLLSYALIGFFLSLAYEKTKTIFGSMSLHLLNNAIAFLLLLL